MRFLALSMALLASTLSGVLAEDGELKIDVTKKVECDRKTKKGDKIDVHYRGTLAKDGSEFDSSHGRGQPLSFNLGQGMVIKGWDDGLLDMCIGEERKLSIPASLAYGDRSVGPIPAGSALVFETKLMGIQGVEAPQKASKSAKSVASSVVSSVEDKATEGVKEKIMSKVGEAAEALKVTVADTDGDGQEHNEL